MSTTNSGIYGDAMKKSRGMYREAVSAVTIQKPKKKKFPAYEKKQRRAAIAELRSQ